MLKNKFAGDIKWNFASKFIIDQKGNIVARIDMKSKKEQGWDQVIQIVEKLLASQAKDGGDKDNEKGKL